MSDFQVGDLVSISGGAGPPEVGTVLAIGSAPTGSLHIDTARGEIYVNTGGSSWVTLGGVSTTIYACYEEGDRVELLPHVVFPHGRRGTVVEVDPGGVLVLHDGDVCGPYGWGYSEVEKVNPLLELSEVANAAD